MTLEQYEVRISRAELRMQRATSSIWAHRWCGVFLRNISARNAMRSVDEVREIEQARGLR
jgi:hypothetical protein